MTFLTTSELDQKIAEWERSLSRSSLRSFDGGAAALLVLDMQNDFLLENGQLPVWGGPAVIPRVAALIRCFRSMGRPVFFSRHLCIEPHAHREELDVMRFIRHPETFLRDGCTGADIHTDLLPATGEFVITKYRYSVFYETSLETLLRVHKVAQVVITGVASNICCEATAHDAFFRGFKVLFTIDATGGTDEGAHLATLRNIQLAYGRLVTVEELRNCFQDSKGGAP